MFMGFLDTFKEFVGITYNGVAEEMAPRGMDVRLTWHVCPQA